ncbi:MAG TPA: hypothetical protein VLA00_14770 [Xanthobacteraceae bacterium]|nr:hypothetical protein [Xanthobacteraceae bacterium]
MVSFSTEEATAIALLLVFAGAALGAGLIGVALYTARAMRRHYGLANFRGEGWIVVTDSVLVCRDPSASASSSSPPQSGQNAFGLERKVMRR